MGNDGDHEEYIDMEVLSSTTLLCSSPQSREFEFQMCCSISNDKDSTTSPADELFYNGKLLPLHLPPRLQMVFEEQKKCSTAPCTNANNTPLESCNISPSESCRVSCELNPDEYYFEWTTDLISFIDDEGSTNNQLPKMKSWSKKLKLIKDLALGQKLKASRAYLKSLFNNKSEAEKGDSNKVSKKIIPFGYKVAKAPFPTIGNIIKSNEKEDQNDQESSHRRSFSRALKRHAPTKCLSSTSSSSGSNSSSLSLSESNSSSSVSLNAVNGSFYELKLLKRSSSDTTEIESSIQAAIAHCKKSQHPLHLTTKPNEASGLCSFSATYQDQDRVANVCKI